MVNVNKILKFANTFGDLAGLESALWDGSPPVTVVAPAQPATLTPGSNPPLTTLQSTTPTASAEVPGYIRLTQTPGQDVQQKSYEILRQIIGQPMGTTIPFTMNGVNYMACLEPHPPSPRNPNPHPGISLFVQSGGAVQGPANPILQPGGSIQLSERTRQKISELQPPEFQEQIRQLMLRGLQEGLRPEIVEGFRSQERQNELYEQGRTKPGSIVTQTRSSMHTQRMAVDIAQLDEKGKITYNPDPPEFWNRMGAIGRSIGLNWGGDWSGFKDRPHFQYRPQR
jgi:hypothetical protein